MNYKEYKEHIKDMTREELIAECLSLKANYDKSCRSWSYTEGLRLDAVEHFNELQAVIDKMFKDIQDKYQELVNEYNISMRDRYEHLKKLDREYQEEMKDE